MRNGKTTKSPAAPEETGMSARIVSASQYGPDPGNRETSSFADMLTRDFHLPLTIIGNYCQTILEMRCGRLDEPCKEHLLKIYAEIGKMSQRIRALLSSPQELRIDVDAEPVDLGEMAKSIIESLMLTKPQRRVKFVVGRDVLAEGDAGLLRIALKNLLDNAWKYTAHKEEALIEFGITPLPGENAYFVRDNGVGFDLAEMGAMFGSDGPRDGFAGSGIGLDTVKKIIHRHNGRIWADGKAATGATIYFTLG